MADAPEQDTEFSIQKIYIKDISFEAPGTPKAFKEDWAPELNIELNTQATTLEDTVYETVLSVTATVKNQGDTAFIVEIQQAGIFGIKGLSEEQLHHALGSFCPNILFPYAREAISDLVTRGGFPQLLLSPVNFDALYAQHLEQANTEEKKEESGVH